MMKLIRMNGKAILNLYDMQHNFDALALCAQADAFLSFAKIHCLSLPTLCEGETAMYVTKNFWYQLLETMMDQPAVSVDDCFVAWGRDLAEKHLEAGMRRNEVLAAVYGEMADMMLPEKLDSLLNANMDDAQALMLLAICELCEIDVRDLTFNADEQEETIETAACDDAKIVVLYSEAQHHEAAAAAESAIRAFVLPGGRQRTAQYRTRSIHPGGPGRRNKTAPLDASCIRMVQEGMLAAANTYRRVYGGPADSQAAA